MVEVGTKANKEENTLGIIVGTVEKGHSKVFV